MNKRKPHIFTTKIMENTEFFVKILIFGFRNTDFDRWRLAAVHWLETKTKTHWLETKTRTARPRPTGLRPRPTGLRPRLETKTNWLETKTHWLETKTHQLAWYQDWDFCFWDWDLKTLRPRHLNLIMWYIRAMCWRIIFVQGKVDWVIFFIGIILTVVLKGFIHELHVSRL